MDNLGGLIGKVSGKIVIQEHYSNKNRKDSVIKKSRVKSSKNSDIFFEQTNPSFISQTAQ